jgi:hypothetical protein
MTVRAPSAARCRRSSRIDRLRSNVTAGTESSGHFCRMVVDATKPPPTLRPCQLQHVQMCRIVPSGPVPPLLVRDRLEVHWLIAVGPGTHGIDRQPEARRPHQTLHRPEAWFLGLPALGPRNGTDRNVRQSRQLALAQVGPATNRSKHRADV